MRGTPTIGNVTDPKTGLIPTYAGNTMKVASPGSRSRAHPHVCGEHLLARSGSRFGGGSSPRMRGTPGCVFMATCAIGLIPTYAGNTTMSTRQSLICGAHPHVCGEHIHNNTTEFGHEGSSPRMRGTHLQLTRLARTKGLIPTYAGNTAWSLRCGLPARAHPHVCGEHQTPQTLSIPPKGSSPRMRGTQVPGQTVAYSLGLIPTYAGNT